MDSSRDRLHAVVGVDLEGDDLAGDMDHARPAGYREALGRRGQVFDVDHRPHASLMVLEANSEGVAGGVFQVGDQPGRREDRRHPAVREADPVLRAHGDDLLPAQTDPRNLLHGKTFHFPKGAASEQDSRRSGNPTKAENPTNSIISLTLATGLTIMIIDK